MRQAVHEPAASARPARLVAGPLAEQELREPEREPLLADARRAREEQDLREPSAAPRPGEPATGVAVSYQGVHRHG
jgi:hypothetical protein